MATDREQFEYNTAKQILLITRQFLDKKLPKRKRKKERNKCQSQRTDK